MHSSRMRTGRSLTVCWHLLPGGVPGRGVCSWGGAWSGGVCSRRGGCLVRGGGVPGQGGGGVPGPGGSAPGGVVCLVWGWGVGVPGPGGVAWSGESVPGLGGSGIPACTEADTLPPCGQNHRRL